MGLFVDKGPDFSRIPKTQKDRDLTGSGTGSAKLLLGVGSVAKKTLEKGKIFFTQRKKYVVW